MKHFIAALICSVSLATCVHAHREVTKLNQPIVLVSAEVTAAEKTAPAKTEVVAEKTSSAQSEDQSKSLADKALTVLKSIEAILTALITLCVILGGVAAKWKARLTKTKKAIHLLTFKIEENTKAHATAGGNLKSSISKAASDDAAVGAIIHESAKVAEAKANGGT